jgi:hypothetical protein
MNMNSNVCSGCGQAIDPKWKVCPACGTQVKKLRLCPGCKRELEGSWKSCPYCGVVIIESVGPSVSIKDSVVKEVHQTQQTEIHEAKGATVGGNININVGKDNKESPEYKYEKYVMAILQSGGSLDRARTQLEQHRFEFGISLKQSKEVEAHCLEATNRNASYFPKTEEIQNNRTAGSVPQGSGIPKTTRRKRLRLWGILVGSLVVVGIIITLVLVLNNKSTPSSTPTKVIAPHSTKSVPAITTSPATSTTTNLALTPEVIQAQNTTAQNIAPLATTKYTYNTTVTPVGGGSISPNTGSYENGSQVTLLASPAKGYQFASWSGDASGTSPSITIILDSNKNIVANFEKLNISINPPVGLPAGATNQILTFSTSANTNNSNLEYCFDWGDGTYSAWSSSPSSTHSWPKPGIYLVKAQARSSTLVSEWSSGMSVNISTSDSDGDGLTDDEEKQIGTNPAFADTDHDGLNDYDEVKVKKTDPLNPDTDSDGVQDGSDLFPLKNGLVKVSIKSFQDTSSSGQGADSGGPGDPYFIITAGNLQQKSKTLGDGITSLNNPFSATFDVPDDQQYVTITVAVWDDDGGWTGDEQYDCSSVAGNTSDSWVYKKQFNILGSKITETTDGAADGSAAGPQAKIVVEIATIS